MQWDSNVASSSAVVVGGVGVAAGVVAIVVVVDEFVDFHCDGGGVRKNQRQHDADHDRVRNMSDHVVVQDAVLSIGLVLVRTYMPDEIIASLPVVPQSSLSAAAMIVVAVVVEESSPCFKCFLVYRGQ